ncbi:MAG: uncharacterized protein K0R15_664 [Clostridiales bacterium]|nr:uncharacterized protein [Clostridiales bacterium]
MNKELEILRIVENNEKTSQREFAKKLYVSLGTANALVQKLITEGYVDLVQLDSRAVNYLITESGRFKKAELMYEEVIEAYDVISNFKKIVRDKLEALMNKGVNKFYLFGDEDDLYKLVKMSLLELRRNNDIEYSKPDELIHINDKKATTIVWNADIIKKFDRKNDNVVYILD